MALAQQRLPWMAAGAALGVAGCVALRRLLHRAIGRHPVLLEPVAQHIRGQDFRGHTSNYLRRDLPGVVGLLAYDICPPLTLEEYDRWLFDIHYHDLLANPHLEGVVLRTVCRNKPARLSNGASVENGVVFTRLAELHFRDQAAYSEYLNWFQANVVPPERTPAGRSLFKFYLLAESLSIFRDCAPGLPSAEPLALFAGGRAKVGTTTVPVIGRPNILEKPAGTTRVLVVGASGTIGKQVVSLLNKRGDIRIVEAMRTGEGSDAVTLDITDVASIKALDRVLPRGSVDHVVVCAGLSTFGPIRSFDAQKWELNCDGKLLAVSRLIVMLVNAEEVGCLRDGGSITVTTGQSSRTVNRSWPGLAVNNAALEAFVRCAGVDAPRGVRINAVSPALVRETAAKAGLPSEGTVPAAEAAAAFLPLIFGDVSGQVVDAGSQTVFTRPHQQ